MRSTNLNIRDFINADPLTNFKAQSWTESGKISNRNCCSAPALPGAPILVLHAPEVTRTGVFKRYHRYYLLMYPAISASSTTVNTRKRQKKPTKIFVSSVVLFPWWGLPVFGQVGPHLKFTVSNKSANESSNSSHSISSSPSSPTGDLLAYHQHGGQELTLVLSRGGSNLVWKRSSR